MSAQQMRCTIMRGGTSKAVFLRASDLPVDPAERDRTILAIFGSPDKRQIDGLGGADPLTSKLAIIAPSSSGDKAAADTDVIYTFGQVEIDEPTIDWLSLCGNISAAVGLYAVQDKLAPITEPLTRVRVFNTNLKRKLWVEVPVADGRPVEEGDYAMPGVPGTGPRLLVDFVDTAGAATGGLLPTGKPIDLLPVAGMDPIEVSLVDIGNAHVFVRARDVGLVGTETAAEIDANLDLRNRLERIRGAAAVRMGMLKDAAASAKETPATPILGIVSPQAGYHAVLAGRTIAAGEVDLVSRVMFMQQAHKTYAGTSTVCTGVAARIPGTLVYEQAAPQTRDRPVVRIGHPAGVIETETVVVMDNGIPTVRRATLGRTARRILDGQVYVNPKKNVEHAA